MAPSFPSEGAAGHGMKKPSLTVLGGPLAGVSCPLPESGTVTVGSAPESSLRLDFAGIAPLHACVVIEDGRAVLYDAGAERKLHVNDSPVDLEGTVLRNGDVIWLGSPGDEGVVMLQCILPPGSPTVGDRKPAAESPAPAEAPVGDEAPAGTPEPVEAVVNSRGHDLPPAEPTPHIETVALQTGPTAAAEPPPERAAEAPDLSPVEWVAEPEPDGAGLAEPAEEPRAEPAAEEPAPEPAEEEAELVAATPVVDAADGFEPEETELVAEVVVAPEADEILPARLPEREPTETVAFMAPVLPPEPPPAAAAPADEPVEETFILEAEPAPKSKPPVEEPTVLFTPPSLPPPPAPDFEDETLALPAPAPPVEPTVAMPPPTPVLPAPPVAAPPVSKPAAPTAPPAAASPAPPGAPRPPVAPRRPAPSAGRREPPARLATGPVRTATPPAAAPAPSPDHEPPAAPRGRSILPIAAAAGIVALSVVGYVAWRFLGSRSAPAPAATPAVARTTPAPVIVPTAEPTPEAVLPTAAPPAPEPTPEAPPTSAPAPVAAPTPTPRATPTPRPTPTPPPPAAPAPAAAPVAPSPAVQAQALAEQAEAALAAGQLDAAIGHADGALRLDAQNARASAARAEATRRRDLARRRFVAGRTAVATQKKASGPAGFEDADVRAAPDFLGRIEFEMSPSTGLGPGAPWTLRVFVVNDGKKSIKVSGVTVATTVNGAGGGGAVSPRVKEIEPQQRALVGETSGSWSDGTTSWSAEATVTANRGDSLRNTLSWR